MMLCVRLKERDVWNQWNAQILCNVFQREEGIQTGGGMDIAMSMLARSKIENNNRSPIFHDFGYGLTHPSCVDNCGLENAISILVVSFGSLTLGELILSSMFREWRE
jgi:hypothetical protein